MHGATVALVRKELRELLPLWGVTMAGLLAIALWEVLPPAALFALPGAALGLLAPIALGAIAMGHEFRHGTLAPLLVLPTSRWRLLLVKLLVVAVLLAGMAGMAWWAGVRTPWMWVPVACGLCLAPFFSLVIRSETAGLVFAGAVPALLLLGGAMTGELVYGPSLDARPAADALRNEIVGVGTAIASILALVGTVRCFLGLEVFDHAGPRTAAHATSRARPSVRRRHAPVRTLLHKELRLQTLPLAVAAATVALWAVLAWLPDDYGAIERVTAVLRPLMAVLLALLVGALAGAEERHLGTWASQMLIPAPLWKQWTVKLGVVVALGWLSGATVPGTVRLSLGHWIYWTGGTMTVVTMLAAVLALYCGSLCRRSVNGFLVAALATVCVGLASAAFMRAFVLFLYQLPQLVLRSVVPMLSLSRDQARLLVEGLHASVLTFLVAVIAKLALDNYRSLHVPGRIVVRHVVIIIIVGALGLTMWNVARDLEFEVWRVLLRRS